MARALNGQVQNPARESGRKLRNRIILANAIVWVGIVVAIRFIFF